MSVSITLALWAAVMAVFMDFLLEKVVNGFIILCLGAGLFCQLYAYGFWGAVFFAEGAAFPVLLLLPLFYFRMLGAGDVKLFSALGGILGVSRIFSILLTSFALGAVLSLVFLISCGNIRERLIYFIRYVGCCYETGKVRPYRRGSIEEAENFHFTVPVLLGTMLYAGGFY